MCLMEEWRKIVACLCHFVCDLYIIIRYIVWGEGSLYIDMWDVYIPCLYTLGSIKAWSLSPHALPRPLYPPPPPPHLYHSHSSSSLCPSLSPSSLCPFLSPSSLCPSLSPSSLCPSLSLHLSAPPFPLHLSAPPFPLHLSAPPFPFISLPLPFPFISLPLPLWHRWSGHWALPTIPSVSDVLCVGAVLMEYIIPVTPGTSCIAFTTTTSERDTHHRLLYCHVMFPLHHHRWGKLEGSTMGTHTGSTSHWVEASLKVALWGHTLDQHHTGLRQVWR